jgi:two-component system, response regulator PdtaR
MLNKRSILIVEDDLFQATVLELILTGLGYKVTGKISTGEEAIETVVKSSPDLIFMDIMLDGEIDGIVATQKIQEIVSIPVIYLTGNADDYHRERAAETDYLAYLIKPITKLLISKTLQEVQF